MNTIKRKFLSGFLALTMITPAFISLSPAVLADEYDSYEKISLLADETAKEVYKFDASTLTAGATITVADYGITPASTSTVIWGTVAENSAGNTMNETGIRYTIRSVKNAGTLMNHVFANDSTNAPSDTMDGSKYTVEHIFTPLIRSGYLYVDINSADGPIARVKIDGQNGTAAKTNAYIADTDGNAVGDKKLNFQTTSSSSAGNPGSVLYLKAEIDNKTKTYSAWLKVAKTSSTGTMNTTVSDSDLLVSNQPFITETAESIKGISYNLQNTSTDTQGVWNQKTIVTKLEEEVVVPTSEPTATPTAVPTATPTAVPTATPTAVPTATPTAVPTATPTAVPTATPTAAPTATPTAVPTATPTAVPTATPTAVPTATPTAVPTATPTAVPTATPTAAPTPTLPAVSGTVIMNEDYTSRTPEEYQWKVTDTALASNGKLTTGTNGLSITKTAAKTAVYTVTGDFSKYMSASDSNSKTYTTSADGQAAIEFDAKFDIADGSNSGGAIYFDIMGSGIASGSTESAFISMGRLRIKPDGSANAYAASGVNGSSSDYPLSANFTGAWHNIRFVYDLTQKTFNIFIDGIQANSEPLKATDWRERTSAMLLNGFKVEMQQLAPESCLSIKNVKVTQISNHTPSSAENAAAAITSIASDQSNVTEDLNLPTKISGFDNASVEWTSSNTDAVTADGKISRTLENQNAVLTAKITDENKYIVYKEFPVTIPKVDDINSAEMILSRAKTYMGTHRITTENYKDITTDLKQLISSWHDDSSNKDVAITWKSSNTSVISDDGKYLAGDKPAETYTIVMTATLSVEGKNAEVTYTLTVNKYSEEKLILSADLNDISPWKYFDKTDPVNSFENVSAAPSNGKFVITKKSVSGESDYSERYRSMYSFRQYVEQYNDATRTATYSQGLDGQFKIVSNATHHITASSQFQVENLAFGNNANAAVYPFPLAINSSKVYNYNDQNNPIFTGNVTDKATDFIYTINTETGEFSVRIGENEEYKTTIDAGTLQGIIYTIKNQAKASDSITVNSIDVYSLGGTPEPNPLAETAQKLTMSMITDTPMAVKESLTLPANAEGASITWTSSDTKLIANDGNLVSAPLDGDKNVVLTAAISKDSDTIYKEFHIVVSKESNPETIIKKDMALVSPSTLTKENTDNISKDLTLPSKGTYGSSITWKSSNTEYITDDGKVVKLGDKNSPEVIMTATFSYEGKTMTKQFKFNMAINFEDGLFTIYETNKIGDTLTKNIKVINGGGKISAADGKIILDRTDRTSSETTSVSIKPTIEDKEVNVTKELVFDADITIPNANTKFEIIPKDANGNKITTIYSGNENGSKPNFTYVMPADSTGKEAHVKEYYTESGTSTNLKFRFHIKPEDGTYTLQYSLNGGAYKTISYNGSTTLKMREATSSLSYFEINAPDNTNDKINNTGKITINNASVSTNKALILKMALEQVNYTAPITSTNGYVSENLNLNINGFPGTTATWTSSNPSILSNEGVVNKENLTENTSVTMTFRLTLNADKEVFYTEALPVTVVYMDPFNLSGGKKAVSNVTANTNHGADKAVDGLFNTSWETMKLNKNANITVDLTDTETFSAIILSEAQILGKYNIQGFTVETSSDNKKWNLIYTGQTLGSAAQTIKFSPASARYVRFTVTKQGDGNVGLNEIQILVGTSDAEIAKTEGKYLANKIGPLRGITSNITLPETKYGCTVKYESSIPEYFSNSGVINRPIDKTVTGTLKIITTYNGVTSTEEIPISIMPPSSGGGGGGGGNAGGTPVYNKNNTDSSGKTSVNQNSSLPAFPKDSTFDSVVQTAFADVSSDFWAYSYIKSLKDKNIVSGDERGYFNPQNNVSRQEFVKMLISALDISLESDAQMTFTDISDADWSYSYIRKAVEMNIVSGVSDTVFDKTSNITREDMAVMCARALKAVNEDVPEKSSADFTDADAISSYALSSVAAIQEKGIINGYEDGSFGPKNNATRSEAARIIYELAK